MGPNTFKAVEIVGHAHKYTRIQELIILPCGFLKYAHKSQGGMHLATQDAHLLNYYYLNIFDFGSINITSLQSDLNGKLWGCKDS